MKLLITPTALQMIKDPAARYATEIAVQEAMSYALDLERDYPRRTGTFTWYAAECPLAVHCREEEGTVLIFTRSYPGCPMMYEALYQSYLEVAVEMPLA